MSNRMLNLIPRIVAVMILVSIFGLSPARAEGGGEAAGSGAEQEIWIALDQAAALQRAQEVVPFVEAVMDECLLCRQQRLRDMGLGVKDIEHRYVVLDSPIIKKREDMYEPVRFMHSKHASSIQDCAVCHHKRPLDKKAKETVRCSACHQDAFNPEHPERMGLKAAYHQQCMECHRDMAKGPVDCTGCHAKKVPDHKELVQLGPDPKPWEVTAEMPALPSGRRRRHYQDGSLALAGTVILYPGS